MTSFSVTSGVTVTFRSPVTCKLVSMLSVVLYISYFRYEDALRDLQDENFLAMAGRSTIRINQIAAK